MDPTYPGAQHLRGAVYLQAGPYDEAIRCFQRAITSSGEDLPVWFVAHLGCAYSRSEEHTSELQSRGHLVCRLPLEKKNMNVRIAGRIEDIQNISHDRPP